MTELGKLTERIDGLKEASRGTMHLQVGAIVVVLLLAAFGAWGLSSQLNNLSVKIDRLEDKINNRIDKAEDKQLNAADRLTRLEVSPRK